MVRQQKLSLLAFAMFRAKLAALAGLLAGVIYGFGGFAIDFLVSAQWLSGETFGTTGLSVGTVLAFGALFGMPVLFAGAGFMLALVEGVLFNGLAGYLRLTADNFWQASQDE